MGREKSGIFARSVVAIAAPLTLAGALAGAGTANAVTPAKVYIQHKVTDVIIVPGQSMGALPYTLMADSIRAQGYRVQALDLRGVDLKADSAAIKRAVDTTVAKHPGANIALVGHSIGGVSSRWYLKNGGGAKNRHVVANIAIGAPQYGSAGACGAAQTPEICPDSKSPYLKQLNAGDDTPGDIFYAAIRSQREWADGRLDGGQCRVTPIPGYDPLPDFGIEHTAEAVDPRVTDAVTTALTGVCVGQFVTESDGAITYDKSEYPNGKPQWSPGGR